MTTSLDHIRDVWVHQPAHDDLFFRRLGGRRGHVAFQSVVFGAILGGATSISLTVSPRTLRFPVEFKAWSFFVASGASTLCYEVACLPAGGGSNGTLGTRAAAFVAATFGSLWLSGSRLRTAWNNRSLFQAAAALCLLPIGLMVGDKGGLLLKKTVGDRSIPLHIAVALIGSYALWQRVGENASRLLFLTSCPFAIVGGAGFPYLVAKAIANAPRELSGLPDEPSPEQWRRLLTRLSPREQADIVRRLNDEQILPIVHLFPLSMVPMRKVLLATWHIEHGQKTHWQVQDAVLHGEFKVSNPEDADEQFLFDLQERRLEKFDDLLPWVALPVRNRFITGYLRRLPPRKWKELADKGVLPPGACWNAIHPDQRLAAPNAHNGRLGAIGYAALRENRVHPSANAHPEQVVHVLAHCTDPKVVKALRATLPKPPQIPRQRTYWKSQPTDRRVQIVTRKDTRHQTTIEMTTQAAVAAGGHFASRLVGGWHTASFKIFVDNADDFAELTWLLRTIQAGDSPSMEELSQHMEVICRYNCESLTELFFYRLAHDYWKVDLDSVERILPELGHPP